MDLVHNFIFFFCAPFFRMIRLPPPTYHFVESIRSGAYGNVSLVKCMEDGKFYAQKLVEGKKEGTEFLLCETQALAQMNHPYIIKVYDYQEIKYENGLSNHTMIMEYVPHGDLLSYLLFCTDQNQESLGEEQSKYILYQILCALQYMKESSHHFIHGDIKPENILITSFTSDPCYPNIKVADFGFVSSLTSPNFNPKADLGCGNMEYGAPEIHFSNLGKPSLQAIFGR